MEIWQRFNPVARRAVLLAHSEAQRTHAPTIDTEHLLTGLLRNEPAKVPEILAMHGVDLDALAADTRARVEAAPVGEPPPEQVPFTADAQQALRLAWAEVEAQEQRELGDHHLLFGLLQLGHGAAHDLLVKHVADPKALSDHLRRMRIARDRPDPLRETPAAQAPAPGMTYAAAGVDIEAGERAVELMKDALRATYDERVLTGLSDFGGMYLLDPSLREPVLVSATDGVGTKLKIAFALDKHDTVGQDLVAMCADDVVVQGARPLFMLDYLGVGKLRPEVVADIVRGIAEACRKIPCALIGGETAELPGFYAEGEYDLAGFAVGVAEREHLIDGSAVQAGDVLLGLGASGLHSNGYSLARAVLLEKAGLSLQEEIPELGRTLGEELLEPTRVYAGPLARLFAEGMYPHALAHITGGGIPGNLARVIPAGLTARLDRGSWPVPPIFSLIQRLGEVAEDEMDRTFNIGLGMIAVVPAEQAEEYQRRLEAEGEKVYVVGEITEAGEDRDRVVL